MQRFLATLAAVVAGGIGSLQAAVTIDFESLPLSVYGTSWWAAANGTWTTDAASGFAMRPEIGDVTG